MLLAHLSDLHLRDARDVVALHHQLDRIVARNPVHLAVTGDLLDRWQPRILEQALDAFAERGLLHADRLTILHGNHDLASSGGHPRGNADLWRLALRFWDPPPLLLSRRRRFYASITARAPGVASCAPVLKALPGLRLAVLDTVPAPWLPLRFGRGAVTVQHAIGCVRHSQIEWLRGQRGDSPLVLLVHHYPLDAPRFDWTPKGRLRTFVREVRVPMAIPADGRERFWSAVQEAGARLVLCGHVHRARLEWMNGVAVGLNGQSGADWAGRTIAYYEVGEGEIVQELESQPVSP